MQLIVRIKFKIFMLQNSCLLTYGLNISILSTRQLLTHLIIHPESNAFGEQNLQQLLVRDNIKVEVIKAAFLPFLYSLNILINTGYLENLVTVIYRV